VCGGVSECPERKERRKRNGHSKPKKGVGAQSPEERECRRESESLNPTGLSHPVIGFCPFDESKCNTYLLICQVICQKFFQAIF